MRVMDQKRQNFLFHYLIEMVEYETENLVILLLCQETSMDALWKTSF